MYALTDTHGSSLRIGYHQAVFHLTTHQTELSFVTLVIFGEQTASKEIAFLWRPHCPSSFFTTSCFFWQLRS